MPTGNETNCTFEFKVNGDINQVTQPRNIGKLIIDGETISTVSSARYKEAPYEAFNRGYNRGYERGLELAKSMVSRSIFKTFPDRIVFNGPATIIFWMDGTKTIVKCGPEDEWDPIKGIALCYMKKYYDNKGNYNDVFRIFEKEIEDEIIIRGHIEHDKKMREKQKNSRIGKCRKEKHG